MSGTSGMVFPRHCKCVGVVKGELDRARPFYFSTEYVVQLPPARPAVWRVLLDGEGMLRRLDRAELLARGDEVALVKETVDVFDRAKLILAAQQRCRGGANTAVFFAPDGHCTFVHRPDASVLRLVQVLDIAPANLATLHRTVRLLDRAGAFGDLEMTFDYVSFDVTRFAGEGTLYPCEASGLDGRYLNVGDVRGVRRLVGCNVSQAVLSALGGRADEFVDFCPHTSPHLRPTAPFLARCCRRERLGPVVRDGQPGVIVHWGVSAPEVYQAVRDLWKLMGEGAGRYERAAGGAGGEG